MFNKITKNDIQFENVSELPKERTIDVLSGCQETLQLYANSLYIAVF